MLGRVSIHGDSVSSPCLSQLAFGLADSVIGFQLSDYDSLINVILFLQHFGGLY
jgi:hypothetical protein